MTTDSRAIVDRLYEALAVADLDRITDLYGPDAVIVRHDGAARGPAEIRTFWERYLANHQPYELHHIVAFRHEDDVVLWDAMITTDAGKLLTYHVMVVADDGTIARHVPLIRGYWGL